MKKNPFDKTLDESEKAKPLAERSEESNIEKARSTLENLKSIDLSTKQGRIDVAFMYSMSLKDSPRFYRTKSSITLDKIIEESVLAHNRRGVDKKFDIPIIDEDNLLPDYRRLHNFYGHELCKRGPSLMNFMFGIFYDFEEDRKMLEGANEEVNNFMFAYILDTSGSLSSETLNSFLVSGYFYELYKKIQSGNFSEEDAKKHPNYPLALELALKSDKQQQTWSDILFKIFSSYVHTGNFVVAELPIEREKMEEIVKKIEELNNVLHQMRPYSIHQDFKYGDIVESVNTSSFSPKLEAEIKALIEYIDYFQQLLDQYNSMMSYHGVEEKTKSNTF